MRVMANGWLYRLMTLQFSRQPVVHCAANLAVGGPQALAAPRTREGRFTRPITVEHKQAPKYQPQLRVAESLRVPQPTMKLPLCWPRIASEDSVTATRNIRCHYTKFHFASRLHERLAYPAGLSTATLQTLPHLQPLIVNVGRRWAPGDRAETQE